MSQCPEQVQISVLLTSAGHGTAAHTGVDGGWWLASSLLARLEQRTKTELKTYSHTQSLSEPELILDQPLREHFELRKITEPHTHILMERYYRQR